MNLFPSTVPTGSNTEKTVTQASLFHFAEKAKAAASWNTRNGVSESLFSLASNWAKCSCCWKFAPGRSSLTSSLVFGRHQVHSPPPGHLKTDGTVATCGSTLWFNIVVQQTRNLKSGSNNSHPFCRFWIMSSKICPCQLHPLHGKTGLKTALHPPSEPLEWGVPKSSQLFWQPTSRRPYPNAQGLCACHANTHTHTRTRVTHTHAHVTHTHAYIYVYMHIYI